MQHGGVVDERLHNQAASASRHRAGLGRRASDPLRDSPALIRRVYSYVAYRIGDGQNAEDVTGDVFERALRYRDTFDPARGSPAGWVLGIARRAVAEHLARPVPDPLSPDHQDTADPSLEATEEAIVQRLSLEDAIASLSDRDQELLSLRYGADLKAREIAAMLALETHAVEVALARATERLRRLLGEA
jgi:RNA polymerase sigma factor (sigma-70 family)